ncbi:hypothetical protein AYX13_02443 [Cryptococcus neoformans]|nr:hypothetical protein AYX13_02443 [Cryptococcus neoformans var. grubii]
MTFNICITGAAGHVGKAVSRAALAKGHRVFGVDLQASSGVSESDKYNYKQLDVRDDSALKTAMKEQGCDAMIHLAAALNNHNSVHKGKDWTESDIHNINTSMSYGILRASSELGIKRVVQASSVNAIGMLGSNPPTFDYLPLDENHPLRPQAAYDLSKQICEVQADAFARKYPWMRIASLRYHWVVDSSLFNLETLHKRGGEPKDLWGYISEKDTAEATLLGLTAPEETFANGHEAFFIVAPVQHQQAATIPLIDKWYPNAEKRREWKGNEGLYDCRKAKRLLGWEAKEYFPWFP